MTHRTRASFLRVAEALGLYGKWICMPLWIRHIDATVVPPAEPMYIFSHRRPHWFTTTVIRVLKDRHRRYCLLRNGTRGGQKHVHLLKDLFAINHQ